MLTLERARTVRANPTAFGTNRTCLESFPLYGEEEDAIVCTDRDLLKSEIVSIPVTNPLELEVVLRGALPTRVCIPPEVTEKFGLPADNRDADELFSFVGVGNCHGNVVSDGSALYPCRLVLQFMKAVPMGHAILMGSVHMVATQDDIPYAKVNLYMFASSVPS